METTSKRKWSHFEHFKTKEKTKSAMVDGYCFADRLLEGVMFVITIQEDGSLKASVREQDKDYMSNLNENKFNSLAVQYAERTDCFFGLDNEENQEFSLIDIENNPSR
jgi:hypothetical protein